MDNRPSFQTTFMQMAQVLAQRSQCQRLKVGCIITDLEHHVLSMGYNGRAPKDNTPCTGQPGACGDFLHAEDNAIARTTPGPLAKLVYCTHSPCYACAVRLVMLGGVSTVYYSATYRNDSGLEYLNKCQIQTKLVPIG